MLDGLGILETLLEDAAALAAVVHATSLHPELYEHDMSCAPHVLVEELRATLAIFRRWHGDNRSGLAGEADAVE